MPDRRIFTTENYSAQNTEILNQNYNNIFSEESPKITDLKESKLSVMSTAQIMQTEDMRQKILSYKLLSEKTIYMNSLQNDPKLKKCNLILFGPSGVGKTSFIKSVHKALFNTNKIPKENSRAYSSAGILPRRDSSFFRPDSAISRPLAFSASICSCDGVFI